MTTEERRTYVLRTILDHSPDLLPLLVQESTSKGYFVPLAKLILNSEEIAARRDAPWVFKSLAEYGEEEFARSSGSWWMASPHGWKKSAAVDLSRCVMQQLWYHQEGLLFFVVSGSSYRLARAGDPAYDFACRLIADQSVGDLEFAAAPSWAHELLLYRDNYDAYCMMWHNDGSTNDPLYAEAKAMRRAAVIHETRRRSSLPIDLDGLGDTDAAHGVDLLLKDSVIPARYEHLSNLQSETLGSAQDSSAKSVSQREHTTYLNIIGAMLEMLMSPRPGRETQSGVITEMVEGWSDKPGISKANLEKKFAEAKRKLRE